METERTVILIFFREASCTRSKEPFGQVESPQPLRSPGEREWQLNARKSAPPPVNSVPFPASNKPIFPQLEGASSGREAFDVSHWKLDAGAEAFCSRLSPSSQQKGSPPQSRAHLEDRSFTTAMLESAAKGK